MAIRGRKPTPVAEKIVLGNPGKRGLTPYVPEPPDGELTPPLDVLEDAVAKRHWDHYVRKFRHLKPGDEPMLADLCLSRSMLDRNRALLKQFGEVVKAPNTGLPIQSPWLAIVNKQVTLSRALAADLCLTPAERNRINPHPSDDDPETDRFFNA